MMAGVAGTESLHYLSLAMLFDTMWYHRDQWVNSSSKMFTKHKEMGSRKGLLDRLQEGWVTNQGPQCWEIEYLWSQEHHAYAI